MTDWIAAQQKAAKTARWFITMTKWLIARLKSRTSWNLVTFTGKAGGESVGIVDVMAIRKDHHKISRGLKRGDGFEIILIQVKGGSAPWPSPDDIQRLVKVGVRYRAKAVVLAEWKKGRQPILYRLNLNRRSLTHGDWQVIEKPLDLFR